VNYNQNVTPGPVTSSSKELALDSIKNLGGVRESDFSTTYSTFNSDPVFDIYKGKCIKFKKAYYSWLQANSSI
jgi:hypothetical protein